MPLSLDLSQALAAGRWARANHAEHLNPYCSREARMTIETPLRQDLAIQWLSGWIQQSAVFDRLAQED
jgi:hypothetical protein